VGLGVACYHASLAKLQDVPSRTAVIAALLRIIGLQQAGSIAGLQGGVVVVVVGEGRKWNEIIARAPLACDLRKLQLNQTALCTSQKVSLFPADSANFPYTSLFAIANCSPSLPSYFKSTEDFMDYPELSPSRAR
jgi:hypothetical protein